MVEKKKKTTKKKTVHSAEPIKKLYRSKEDKVVSGVCGGIGEYFNVDPIWVRLICILLVFLNGMGFLAYLILWILMPENPYQRSSRKTPVEEKVQEFSDEIKKKQTEEKNGHLLFGGILVVIGALFLAENFLGLAIIEDLLWPAIIIGLGVYLIMRK